jgi:3-methyladenine DNA glycosylase AlkD
MASTARAGATLDRLVATYAAAADPAAAGPMRAYMRDQFPFLGIRAPRQRILSREVMAGAGRLDESDLRAVALGCWELPEREYQYFACDLLRRQVKVCSADFLATARRLIVDRSWWDTVDTLASHVVGSLVQRHPALLSTMDDWIEDGNLWVVRTALLHQLRYRAATDSGRLFAYCTRHSGHQDFFVRKAIGWCLREYAKTDPEAVRGYVRAHEHQLAPLSVREALKNIG